MAKAKLNGKTRNTKAVTIPEETGMIRVDKDQFAVFQQIDPNFITDIIKENVGDSLTPLDLLKIKFPAAGGGVFMLPELSGDGLPVKEIEAIILLSKMSRSYWPGPYEGGNEPPQCFSDDCISGQGEPGGGCLECPLAQFGTAEKGGGQACKQVDMMFLLMKGQLLPTLLTLPPTSLKAAKRFKLQLASQGVPYSGVIAKIGLAQNKNKEGISYSQATFAVSRVLNTDETAKVKQMATGFKEAISRVAVSRSDIE